MSFDTKGNEWCPYHDYSNPYRVELLLHVCQNYHKYMTVFDSDYGFTCVYLGQSISSGVYYDNYRAWTR